MKTHTIKTPTAELLIVELPERASMLPVAIINGNTYISYSPAPFAPPTNLELLANGNWEVLGKPDEIREEDLHGIVSDFDAFKTTDEGSGYYDYIESFNSAIESEIYWDVNPLGNEPIFFESTMGKIMDEPKEWERIQAELRTFDRSRSIILAKR